MDSSKFNSEKRLSISDNSMKTKLLITILTILTLLSCKKIKDQQLEKDIVGEWTFVKIVDNSKTNTDSETLPSPLGNTRIGYIFNQNNTCENKLGYFKRINGKTRIDRKIIYLGNETQFKIEDDSLKIFDLSNSTWNSKKILSILGDTLTMQISDSVFSKYARAKYKINPNEHYDKILVSSSGCYGTCPISDISIDKNGKVFYFGERYNTQNGFFTSNIAKEEFRNLELAFKKVDISNLKDSYQSDWTDDETVTITFVKDGKIVKSITDYGREAPIELIWAYTPFRYLYQQIKLEPFKNDKQIFSKWGISFETSHQICTLTKSEGFYLLSEIYEGKEVIQNFKKKYKLEVWNNNDKKEIAFTDGRIFKFKEKTIDIGYNFLTVNNLNTKFRTKNEYEK